MTTTPQRVARWAQDEREREAVRRREMLARIEAVYLTDAGRFVLDRGRWFTPAARPVGVRKRADKACYANAGKHVLGNPACLYVEGFAMAPDGFMAQHAWCAEGNRVIDRTWRKPELCMYFGAAFDAVTFSRLMLDRREWSLFHDGYVPANLAVVEAELEKQRR